MIYLVSPTQTHVPIMLQGPSRSVRTALFLIYHSISDRYFRGNLSLGPSLLVQFKFFEITAQDVMSLQEVAARTGCIQFSETREEDVTFQGSLPCITAAMSYMFLF